MPAVHKRNATVKAPQKCPIKPHWYSRHCRSDGWWKIGLAKNISFAETWGQLVKRHIYHCNRMVAHAYQLFMKAVNVEALAKKKDALYRRRAYKSYCKKWKAWLQVFYLWKVFIAIFFWWKLVVAFKFLITIHSCSRTHFSLLRRKKFQKAALAHPCASLHSCFLRISGAYGSAWCVLTSPI